MKIAIVGSRRFPRIYAVRDWIVRHVDPSDTIVTGGARGVDEYALTIGLDIGVRVLVIPPPAGPQSYGQRCAIRNNWIVAECDRLVAFWDGESPGTRMTIGFAKAAKKRVTVIRENGSEEGTAAP